MLTEAITNGGFWSIFEQRYHAPAFVLVDSGEPRTPPLVIASERQTVQKLTVNC